MTFPDKLVADLSKLINHFKLDLHHDTILATAQQAVALTPTAENSAEIEIGTSELGGRPDILPDFHWPEHDGYPLSFIAQINLADIAAVLPNSSLPQTGLLSFFYGNRVWGFDPKDKDGFRVFYYNGDPKTFCRQWNPVPPQKKKGLLDFFKSEPEFQEYKACRFKFDTFLCLPEDPPESISDEGEIEMYYELLEEIGNHHRLLGFAEPIQSPMEDECALIEAGLSGDTQGYRDPRAPEIRQNKNKWRLLLQIDTDTENSNMMWGDAGRLYFWIKDEDLADQNFDNCWLISQCY